MRYLESTTGTFSDVCASKHILSIVGGGESRRYSWIRVLADVIIVRFDHARVKVRCASAKGLRTGGGGRIDCSITTLSAS